jgi:hypothetical protein
MKARAAQILCVVILFMFCQGCSDAAPTAAPAPASGTLLFSDDFSAAPGSWGTWSDAGAMITYEGGGLRILVNETDFDYWSVAGQNFSDVQIEVDITRLGGPTDNDFGVVCRYRDEKNFYMFLVSSDGYYGIGKIKDDQHSLIGTDQLQYSAQILPDQTMHHVRADCVGQTLRLFVDGNLLLEAQDSDFSAGDVGVLAGSYATPGVDILFDNFTVKQP